LEARGYVSSLALEECAQGQRVRTIGTVVVHQAPPTAKGFAFLTVEDEYGLMNIIMRPALAATYRMRRPGYLLIVEGVVQHEGGVTNLLATRLTPLETH
jgi:error-prone DNA polymerase